MTTESINTINNLVIDLKKLSNFLEILQNQRALVSNPIQSLYLTLKNGFQVEIKNAIDIETSQEILQLLINSRNCKKIHLEKQLQLLIQEASLNPIPSNKD
jgi:hypothetical protein